jgi:hypothetical protein
MLEMIHKETISVSNKTFFKHVFTRVRKTAKSDYCLRHVCPSVRPSFCPSARLSVRLTVRPSVRPSVGPSVRLSVCPTLRPSVRPSVLPSVCPTLRPSDCPSVRPSVRPHVTTLLTLDGFSWNLIFEDFFGHLSRKFEIYWKLRKIAGTLPADLFTFMTTSCRMLLRMNKCFRQRL